MTALPPPVDVEQNPYLTGCFEPVGAEGDYPMLTVSQGEIPAGLNGTYIRNGPNPRFTPIGSYVYPVDGDGMVHAITLADGDATYRNRFVRTPMVRREEEVGHALWPGIMSPFLPDEQLVGAALANKWKDLPGINVVRHHGKLIALAEMSSSYCLDEDLSTLAAETYGGVFPAGTCAHPKVDPVTGEMIVFTYDVTPPYLQWAAVGADGTVTAGPHQIDLPGSYMIHDFAITATSVVLVVNPFAIDIELAMSGGSPLEWKPELGCRVAVISRKTGDISWHHGDAFWSWHFANAFDSDEGIVLDAAVWDHPSLSAGTDHLPPSRGRFSRIVLPNGSDIIRMNELVDRPMEFPRIDDRLTGQQHQQVALGARTGREIPPGQFDAVITISPDTGQVCQFDAGDYSLGEPCFVPDANGGAGYFVTFGTDRTTMRSAFLMLPADDVSAGPVATVDIPVRVPLGLHGAWLPGT